MQDRQEAQQSPRPARGGPEVGQTSEATFTQADRGRFDSVEVRDQFSSRASAWNWSQVLPPASARATITAAGSSNSWMCRESNSEASHPTPPPTDSVVSLGSIASPVQGSRNP